MDNRRGLRHNERMMVCRQVRYSGRVQGVGFRYVTHRLAEGFPVAGYVRNLSDGSVEVVAEGERTDVGAFLEALERRMTGYIKNRSVIDAPTAGFTGFAIRY
jgi:acylphosphatase